MKSTSTPILLGIGAIIGSILIVQPSQAQVNQYSQPQRYRDYVQPYDLNIYREVAGRKQQLYDQHTQSIQQKIDNIQERLGDLGSVNPDASTAIGSRVIQYLERLNNSNIDYSDSEVYRQITGALNSFNNSISQAFRVPPPQSPPQKSFDHFNKVAKTFTYAPIYSEPSLSSKLIHSVEKNEKVTILDEFSTFYIVKCGPYKGYLSKGMIEYILP